MDSLTTLLEAMSGQDFYQKLTSTEFKPRGTFTISIPFRINGKKINVTIPIDLKMDEIEREVKEYLTAPPEVKEKFDTYAFWYDNYNKLIFSSMPENDACLFLAAVAYCSANTALDQNVLEAAKLFEAVKADFSTEEGRRMLAELSTFAKDNTKNETLQRLKSYVERGSAYAKLIVPKKDYKGGITQVGPRKGQDDIFSEITVSGAKLPNFNLFVKYYLEHNGQVTKKEILDDFKDGKLNIGGTKIGSFFMNLVFPEYQWNDKLNPATIDRWMIRVFFDKSMEEIVKNDIHDWISAVTELQGVNVGKKDKPADLDIKRSKALLKNENKITQLGIMQLFSNDTVRQNLVKILHEEASKMGLTSYQLQALAWVNIRIRYKEPAAKFAKFEDVMEYAEEAAGNILGLDPNVNKVVNTIKTLAAGPRFKFKNPQDVVDTLQNRDKYTNVFNLQPKNDPNVPSPTTSAPASSPAATKRSAEPADSVQNRDQYNVVYALPPKVKTALKLGKESTMSDADWMKMRVAVRGNKVDIFDLGTSTKTPIHTLTGTNRRAMLTKALIWTLGYSPRHEPSIG
jgi:hypothetical protein